MNALFHNQSAPLGLAVWVQEPLFLGRTDGTWEPLLAAEVPTVENGGVTEDGLKVTYRLRPDVTWSDGEPFTAEDLEFTYDVIRNPKSTTIAPTEYNLVRAVRVVDPQTVEVTMKRPNPYYLGLFRQTLPKHKFRSSAVTTEDPQARLPLGTGPFTYTNWETGNKIVLERNEAYWRSDRRPKLDGITLRVTPDAQTAINSFTRGEYDSVFFITAGDMPTLRSAQESGAAIEVSPREGSHVEWLWLNQSDKGSDRPHRVLGDPAIREAIDLAIDRQQIVDEVLDGLGTLTGAFVYSGFARVDRPAAPFDPERANELLDAAGWVRGDDGIRVKDGVRASLRFQTLSGDQTRELYQQVIQQNLEEVGIEVKIQNLPSNLIFGTYDEGGRLARGDYDIVMSREGLARDPIEGGWAAMFTCAEVPGPDNKNGTSYVHWCNEEFDRLVGRAASTLDVEERKDLYEQAVELFATERPALPLYSSTSGYTWSTRMKGVDVDWWDGMWPSAADWWLER
nr:peptide ABC transporter substrate-binding protein [Conexibacter arvalis]